MTERHSGWSRRAFLKAASAGCVATLKNVSAAASGDGMVVPTRPFGKTGGWTLKGVRNKIDHHPITFLVKDSHPFSCRIQV